MLCLSSGPQGGRHIDYVADQVVGKLIEVVKKKNKAGVAVKPFQVQSLLQCGVVDWKIFQNFSASKIIN